MENKLRIRFELVDESTTDIIVITREGDDSYDN